MFYTHKASLEKPVVFLHGFLGTHADWDDFLPSFSHTYAFDLPHHGKSPAYSLDDLYQALPQDAHLIGYSLGGRIAMRLLFSYPPKFSSLTLISAHPGLDDSVEKEKRIQSDEAWGSLLDTLSMEEFLKKWYSRPLFAKSPIPSSRKEQNKVGLKEILLTYSLGRQTSYWKEIEKTDTPLLFLFGEEDQNFLPIYERVRTFPRVTTSLIPGATHALHLEKPKQVLGIIQEFLPPVHRMI